MENYAATSWQIGPLRSGSYFRSSRRTAGFEDERVFQADASCQVGSLTGGASYSRSETIETVHPPAASEDERVWSQTKREESFYDSPTNAPFAPLNGTCRWVTATTAYRNWALRDRGFLSISGSPGSGKSCLLSWMGSVGLADKNLTPVPFLVGKNRPTNTNEPPLILYYSPGQRQGGNRPGRLLDSLIFNLRRVGLSQDLDFPPTEQASSPSDLLPAAIQSVIEAAKSRLIFWLIDGLDDLLADEKRADQTPWLLGFLGSMMQEASTANVPLHICYTKRDHPAISESLLEKSGDYSYFGLRVDDHNRFDIERFLENTTRLLSGELSSDDMNRLRDGIMDRVGSGFAAAAAYVKELRKLHQITDQIDTLPLPPAVGDMWHCVLYQLDLEQLALVGLVMTAQRPLAPREFSCVSGFTLIDDLSEYNSKLIESTMGLLRLELMPDGRTPCVMLAQKSLATYFESQPGHRVMEGFVHEKGNRVGEECHCRFAETGLLALKECFPSYREYWLGLLPEYEGPALVLEGDGTQEVEFSEELVDLLQRPMLEYTVEHLMEHAASINNMNELRELSRELDHYSVDGEAADLLSMWCHLHNSLRGAPIYGPGVTIWHVLAQYNVSDYLARLPKEDWNAAVETDNGQTLLHWTAFYNSKESMRVILSTHFDDFEVKTRAPGEAASTLSVESALYMVNYREKQHGRTALHLAAAKGHVEVLALLLTHERSLRAKLSEALGVKRTEIRETEPGSGNINSGIDSMATDGSTALHYGACSKEPEIVAALLEEGADWRLGNNRGESALQLAIRIAGQEVSLEEKTKEVVRILKASTFADIGLARALKSGTGAVDAQFYAHKVDFNGSKPTIIRLSIKHLLSDRCSLLDDRSKCTWIHLPANNMSWTEVLLLRLLSQKGAKNPTALRDDIMRREFWTDRHTRGSLRSFISFMRSGCEKIDLTDTMADAMVLYMPYIHWETQKKQMTLEYFSLCKFIAELDQSMVHGFLSQFAAEQPARELVHSADVPILLYLSNMINTYSRVAMDFDGSNNRARAFEDALRRREVLARSKHLASDPDLDLIDLYASNSTRSHPLHPRRTLDQYFYYTLNNTTHRNQDQVVARHGQRKGKKQPVVLMSPPNVIVSAFPQRRECGVDDPDRFDTTDVLENILASLAANPLNMAEDTAPMELVLRIVRECSSICFDPMKNLDDDFQFLDIFNNSINRVADEEMKCYEHFLDALRTTGNQAQLPTNREFHLLREIKDIIEELRMLLQVFDEQQDVLSSMTKKLSLSPSLLDLHGPLVAEGVRYMRRIDMMQREAERTNYSINSLMELRQRHATLSEAQATGRQGNTIMVFTVVTILFLPASFMASFFALPVAQFAHVPEDAENMDLAYIVRWLLVFTVPVAILFISLAFYINDVLTFLSVVHRTAKSIGDRVLMGTAAICRERLRFVYRRLVFIHVYVFGLLLRYIFLGKEQVDHDLWPGPQGKSPVEEERAQSDVRRRRGFTLWSRTKPR